MSNFVLNSLPLCDYIALFSKPVNWCAGEQLRNLKSIARLTWPVEIFLAVVAGR
jgi:hypothetical protein